MDRRDLGKLVHTEVFAIFGILFILYLISHSSTLFGIASFSAILATLILLLEQNRIRVTLPGGISFFIIASLLLLSFEINREAGMIATLFALLIWFQKGRMHLWFPASFWIVIVAVVGLGLLQRNGGLDQMTASITISIIALGILLIQAGVFKFNRDMI